MPNSHFAAKKILATLGLDYESIHACSNDHVLIKKELANQEKCHVCDAPCYHQDVQGDKIPN